ncbi:hypothetical protein J22TS1_10740 [Siminovitchia terrae]|uniref:DUF3885 domain-containing protein n=1 Tax=Siminovitchia terrae TaxID=1914933 RepID=UPI001B027C9F|nr:DUF3885 domain-containing protein [Siminovitchia terrae]GIN90023.1 hypothetical protein J22TS1_10740 [Siminovitchia terrae]
MSEILHSFIKKNFTGLTLRPSLFYLWKYGIRFEISKPGRPHFEKDNLKQIFHRTNTLFDKVFGEEDELLFVTDVYTAKHSPLLQRKPLNVYRKYVKDKQKLYQLQHHLLPYLFEDDEEETEQSVTHRFVLSFKKMEIKYHHVLKAISHKDFTPTILKNNLESGYDIYFVNLTNKIIFHLYDDRGCDIIASDNEAIRFLYDEYNEWILDYDREEINRVFRSKPTSAILSQG